jgi:hypothetical protein
MWPFGSPPLLAQDPCDDMDGDGEADGCKITHFWYRWQQPMCMSGIPGTTVPPCSTEGWADPDGNVVWTGFYGGNGIAAPLGYNLGGTYVPPTSIGARVLGQSVNDHFGTAVGSDGTWLYISAPRHTALQEDVPALSGDRTQSGVVYQLRTDLRATPQQPNLAQLWMEPGATWPVVDAEIEGRTDYTMPVPHQYIIESVGSIRGRYWRDDDPEYQHVVYEGLDECPESTLNRIIDEVINKAWATSDPPEFTGISTAPLVTSYIPYPTDSAGYLTDRTPQIVGPHPDAEISFVRGLGDVDGDSFRDFAVGSANVQDPATGDTVGAIYVVYGRAVGLEGDYLLENMALAPSDPDRIRGIMLKGASAGETLARVFADAGDFNDDGYTDVVVGNEAADTDTGEAIVILGSRNLESPENGWTADDIVAEGHGIRFHGAAAGDLTGANVAGAGDVDGDGFSDILIAAPGAANGIGVVYLIYGSDDLVGELSLADIGTVDLPGVKFVGRSSGDQLGGGTKLIADAAPGGASTTAISRGVARLGDIDGDGRDDYAISAMLADPNERTDAGEIYILYGRGD